MISNIEISKIGVKYEVVYYYKQKVVNWDFVAPSFYECQFNTLESSTNQYLQGSLSLKQSGSYVYTTLSTHITEDSYRDNAIYYTLTISNVSLNSVPLVLQEYKNTNIHTEMIDVESNITFTANYTYTPEDIYIKFDAPLTYPITDSIITKIFTQFPNGVYIDETTYVESSINFEADCDMVSLTKSNPSRSTAHIPSLKNYRKILNTSIKNDSVLVPLNNITNLYSVYCIDNIRLPISTETASGNEHIMSGVYINKQNLYASSNFSFLESSTIVH
jgi:hypothetical protein